MNSISQYLTFNFPYDSMSLSVDNSTNQVSLTFDYSQSLNSGDPPSVSYTGPGAAVSTVLTLP